MDLKVPTASPWSVEYTGVKIMVISQLQHLLFITFTIHKSLIVLDIDALVVLDLEIFMRAGRTSMLAEANTLAYSKKIILNAKKCFITEKRNKSSWHPIIKKPFSDKSRKKFCFCVKVIIVHAIFSPCAKGNC